MSKRLSYLKLSKRQPYFPHSVPEGFLDYIIFGMILSEEHLQNVFLLPFQVSRPRSLPVALPKFVRCEVLALRT